MYQPQTYLRQLDRELSFDEPTLFIVHLTASHWPYFVSDTSVRGSQKKTETTARRIESASGGDAMFGDVVSMLENKARSRTRSSSCSPITARRCSCLRTR
jgi:hypothetical protein